VPAPPFELVSGQDSTAVPLYDITNILGILCTSELESRTCAGLGEAG
jgi:hypothetical protein